MIAAFDLPENKSKGVVSIDGRMVERLHADMARRTVAIAEAIAAQAMRNFITFAFALIAFGAQPTMADDRDIAPGGTLRAVYLAGNPAQAVQDRATGAIRGASADLARELGRRMNMPVEIKPVADPKAVIDAVSGGEADIGFVAFEPSRAGTVEFSQTYMLVRQSFLVLEGSSIRAIADVDRASQKSPARAMIRSRCS